MESQDWPFLAKINNVSGPLLSIFLFFDKRAGYPSNAATNLVYYVMDLLFQTTSAVIIQKVNIITSLSSFSFVNYLVLKIIV